jgi:hypothetical protein
VSHREEALRRTEKEIVAEKAATLGRARALEARRTLIIQREAIGLRSHRIVDQQFPEPPPPA